MKKILSIIALVFALSITANAQFLNTTEIVNSDCRIQFLNSNGIKIYELIGENLTWWKQSSGAIIIRDKVTQVTISATYSGTPAITALDDSLDAWILACKNCCDGSGGGGGGGCLESCTLTENVLINSDGNSITFDGTNHSLNFNTTQSLGFADIDFDGFVSVSNDSSLSSFSGNFVSPLSDSTYLPGEIAILNDPFGTGGEFLFSQTNASGGGLSKSLTISDANTGVTVVVDKNGLDIFPDVFLNAALPDDAIHINNTIDTQEIKLKSNGAIVHTGAYANSSYYIDTTAGGFTIPDNKSYVIYNPNTLQATATITMPANPYDGQEVTLMFGATVIGTVVTSLTVSANVGQTIVFLPAFTATLGTPKKLIFIGATNQWYTSSN